MDQVVSCLVSLYLAGFFVTLVGAGLGVAKEVKAGHEKVAMIGIVLFSLLWPVSVPWAFYGKKQGG